MASNDAESRSAIDNFISHHSRPDSDRAPGSTARLAKPVVIPQRRPGNKERGFVEAFAPDLEQFDIDEESFLEFISALNDAVRASKWLHAIQVGAFGAGFVPNHIALGVSAAVQIVAGIVAKTETRWKTNSFMDRMNEEFFQPRGLYCLIMSYSPVNWTGEASTDSTEAVAAAQSRSSPSAAMSLSMRTKNNLRNPSAGVSKGEESLPDTVADLIYPKTSDVQCGIDSKAKRRAFARMADYADRRAQARYAAESKGDILSLTPQKSFSNRYLDPNHPATNGGLLGLVSGGKLTPDMAKRNEQIKEFMEAQREAILQGQSAQLENYKTVLQSMGLTEEQQRDYLGQYESANALQLKQLHDQSELVKQGQRRITRNILYLMIVNMPTAAEVQTAAANKHNLVAGLEPEPVTVTNTAVD